MFRITLWAGVLAGLSFAQETNPATNKPRTLTYGFSTLTQNVVETASPEPSDPVLLVHIADEHTIAVSRQQFESFLAVASHGRQVTPAMKDRFAKAYAELLALDNAAVDLGIDRSAQYQDTMLWLRTKTLADLLTRRLEKESNAVSAAEIEAYYQDRLTQFAEVKLKRLVLPKNNFAAADRAKFERDALRVARELQERAVQGEDLDQLQKETYEVLGFGGLPPGTDVGYRRKASLPSEVGDIVFALQPGEVSQVQEEPHSFVIYKTEFRRIPPLEQVREEILREVARQKLERARDAIVGRVRMERDEKYFVSASPQP